LQFSSWIRLFSPTFVGLPKIVHAGSTILGPRLDWTDKWVSKSQPSIAHNKPTDWRNVWYEAFHALMTQWFSNTLTLQLSLASLTTVPVARFFALLLFSFIVYFDFIQLINIWLGNAIISFNLIIYSFKYSMSFNIS
jgi:hypothetical protein